MGENPDGLPGLLIGVATLSPAAADRSSCRNGVDGTPGGAGATKMGLCSEEAGTDEAEAEAEVEEGRGDLGDKPSACAGTSSASISPFNI